MENINENSYIDKEIDSLIEKLVTLINIPTVLNHQEKEAPFGMEVKRGLDYVLQLAQSFGMETINYDGFAGEINIGKGDYIIGILCHVDVVSGGEGWDVPPFEAKVAGDKVYGRGSLDDKGPILSCLYAMKYLMDYNKLNEKVTVKMIIGTNEEEDWKCIDYYIRNAGKLPDVSIVPDGNFPVIHCEKGLLDFDLVDTSMVQEQARIKLLHINGGSGRNVVPGKSSCTIRFEKDEDIKFFMNRLKEKKYAKIIERGNEIDVEITGKSTHCMSPEKGQNAISLLIELLSELGPNFSHFLFVQNYKKYIGMDYYGSKFGCGFEDDLSGKLTFNIGTISLIHDRKIFLEANMRYPASFSYDFMIDKVKDSAALAHYEYIHKSHLAPIYFDKDDLLIQKLMNAYVSVTGDDKNKPIAIGGATYARALPNAVAFGPLFPEEEELAHEANEFIRISSLKKMTLIYIKTLISLIEGHSL